MTPLERSLRRAVDDLDALEHRFALVGGLAVSARCEPRLTRDADLAVAVLDDAAAEAVLESLRGVGYDVVALVEQEAADRLATARLVLSTDGSGSVLDLLFASSGIEPEIVDAADVLSVLPDLDLPVARTGHLIVTKLLARDDRHRPTDADDLAALSLVATPADWEEARTGVDLVVQRGFARGRDLAGALADLRDRGAY